MDHWEKFVTMPVRRTVPPTPIVPAARVRGAIGPCAPEQPKPESHPPQEIKRGKPYAARRSSWPLLAELYNKHGSEKPLDWYGPRVGMTDHTSVRYALITMGLYRGKGKPQDVPGPRKTAYVNWKRQQRVEARVAQGYAPNATHQKLTPQQVREMRALAQQGWKRHQLVLRFRVSDTSVRRILAGKQWAHLK